MPDLVRLLVLFGLVYGGFGLLSPYLPALLSARGLGAEAIGLTLAAGTLVKLAVAPALSRIADAQRRVAMALALACLASAGAAAAYAAPISGGALVLLALAQAAALAPLAPFADAVAVSAAARKQFSYGWVRGAGSAAFVAGTLAAGALVAAFGWTAAPLGQALALGAASVFAARAPEPTTAAATPAAEGATALDLLRIKPFRLVMAIAALALGSHALHDGFALLAWTQAGMSPRVAGLLWSEGVAAEIVVFVLIGPPLLRRLGATGALALSIAAAALRWCVMAATTAPAVMACTEPLHGLTFALLHLACMDVIAKHTPTALAASAQALYGAVAVGAANAIVTALSGILFARWGTTSFLFMAALSAAAAPMILVLGRALQKARAAHR